MSFNLKKRAYFNLINNTIFSAPPFAYEYMAVIALDDFEKDEDEQGIVFLRYEEEDDGFILDGIENEIELDCVSEHYFDSMMD